MPFRERLEWCLRMGLLVFILASAAFLSAITTIRFAIRGREVNMPNLVGMKMAEAGKVLSRHGLVLKVADRIYDAAPAGNVIRQSPPPGLKVKVSQDAHVVLSLGPSAHCLCPKSPEKRFAPQEFLCCNPGCNSARSLRRI